MTYESSAVGNEITCVMHGADIGILMDNERLKKLLLEALKQDNFEVLKQVSHEFEPHGFTIAILLAESHAAIHTYPEHNSLVFNIYSCRGPGDGKKTFEFLKERLQPSSVDFREREVWVKSG